MSTRNLVLASAALLYAACAPTLGPPPVGGEPAETDAMPPLGDAGMRPPPPPRLDAGMPDPPPPPASSEICDNGIDDDGNGSVDDGCVCPAGSEPRSCYFGPEGTADVGACRAGTQTCVSTSEFGEWSACDGEIYPDQELCDDSIDNNCDGEIDEECTPPIMPAQCTLMSLTHTVGARDCGPNQAVYMMDDGDGPNFICCPLPASDILLPDPAVVRGTTCAANEVITGAAGRFNMRCSAINTARYQLAAPQLPCYFGSGSSGGGGVVRCASHPTSFSVLVRDLFGSDGCSAQPYGSLFVRQSGDDCRDMRASQLQFSGAVTDDPAGGTPVTMYVE